MFGYFSVILRMLSGIICLRGRTGSDLTLGLLIYNEDEITDFPLITHGVSGADFRWQRLSPIYLT